MKKTNAFILITAGLVGVILIGFQNFTRYKPRNHSRDAAELYMGNALSTALKDEESKQMRDANKIAKEKEKVLEKPAPPERKTSSTHKVSPNSKE